MALKIEIGGHDLKYAITETGDIIGLGRIKNGQKHKTYINKDGYECKTLFCSKCKKRTAVSVHRAVAIMYLPNPNNLECVNHIDGNKLNNHVSNLEWCTADENRAHAIKTGLFDPRGEKNTFAVLTEERVLEIRKKGKYSTYQQIANDNNVSENAIIGVLKRKTWKHI